MDQDRRPGAACEAVSTGISGPGAAQGVRRVAFDAPRTGGRADRSGSATMRPFCRVAPHQRQRPLRRPAAAFSRGICQAAFSGPTFGVEFVGPQLTWFGRRGWTVRLGDLFRVVLIRACGTPADILEWSDAGRWRGLGRVGLQGTTERHMHHHPEAIENLRDRSNIVS
jgi:hypothetical protein